MWPGAPWAREGLELERRRNRGAADRNRLRRAVGVHDIEGHKGAVVHARDDAYFRAARLRKNDQPMRVRAHALVPDRFVSAPPNDLGLLKARVAERTADQERAVPGESLHEDSGKLADHRTTRQLANERRRAAVGVASELFGDVLTIVAGHDPRQRIGIAPLVRHTAIAEGDHADAPRIPGRLAANDRAMG